MLFRLADQSKQESSEDDKFERYFFRASLNIVSTIKDGSGCVGSDAAVTRQFVFYAAASHELTVRG